MQPSEEWSLNLPRGNTSATSFPSFTRPSPRPLASRPALPCSISTPSPSPKAPAWPARSSSASSTPGFLPLRSGSRSSRFNHLEGHIHAVLLESAHLLHAAPDPARDGASREAGAASEAPLLALVVSGGHTHLYLASPPATKQTAGTLHVDLPQRRPHRRRRSRRGLRQGRQAARPRLSRRPVDRRPGSPRQPRSQSAFTSTP